MAQQGPRTFIFCPKNGLPSEYDRSLMSARQIADPQAEWTTKLGHTEEERERMRERLSEAVIVYAVLSLAESKSKGSLVGLCS